MNLKTIKHYESHLTEKKQTKFDQPNNFLPKIYSCCSMHFLFCRPNPTLPSWDSKHIVCVWLHEDSDQQPVHGSICLLCFFSLVSILGVKWSSMLALEEYEFQRNPLDGELVQEGLDFLWPLSKSFYCHMPRHQLLGLRSKVRFWWAAPLAIECLILNLWYIRCKVVFS